MELKYDTFIKYFSAGLAIAFFTVSVFFVFDSPRYWVGYMYLLMSLYYFANFFFMIRCPYVTIKGGLITKNELFEEKQVKITDVRRIKKIAGDYQVSTEDKKPAMVIISWMLEKQSKKDLEKLLEDVNFASKA